MAKKNASRGCAGNVNSDKTKKSPSVGERFLSVVNDKRIMIPITAFLFLCVAALTVLLVLDATGILYGYSDKGKDEGNGDGVVDTELSLMDGVAHQSGAYEYYLLSDGSAAITFYSDSTADIIEIPSEIDGYKITAIGSECFVWLPSLVTVTVPDGVTYIGAMAFEGCGNLFNLRLPESIASIGDNAFKGCSTEMSVEYEGDISKVRLGSGNSALISSLEIGK